MVNSRYFPPRGIPALFGCCQAFYLILNLAVGGKWGREADPQVYPQKFEIDWVKAWEK